jgi:glycerol-3-phosphate acyltransferase PlsY
MDFTELLIALIVGYFSGCIQTSYFVGHYKMKKDIRESGSGNAGASNVVATLGWKWGIFTGFIDILKGAIAVVVMQYLFSKSPELLELQYFAGSMAVIGHIFPFFMKFKGGKGIATFIGMLMAIHFTLGFIMGLIVVFFLLTTGYVALGSVIIYILMPVYGFYIGLSNEIVLITSLLAVIGLYKHRINFIRMKNKTEITLWDVLKKKDHD